MKTRTFLVVESVLLVLLMLSFASAYYLHEQNVKLDNKIHQLDKKIARDLNDLQNQLQQQQNQKRISGYNI